MEMDFEFFSDFPFISFSRVAAAILTNVAQAVYLKQSSNKMPSFPYFLFWFTVIPFAIVFYLFLLVAYLMGGITPEMRYAPPSHSAFLCVICFVNNACITARELI